MRRSPLAHLIALAVVSLTVPGLSGQPVPTKDAPITAPKGQAKDAPKIWDGFVRVRMQEIDTTLAVGYAVLVADVNGDGKPDIVVVDTRRVVWYENPTWQRRTVIEGQTQSDNVSIAAADLDGDGQLDFVLAAGWRNLNTSTPGTLQWLKRGRTLDEPWTLHPIPCDEPTVHRVRFADLDGDGKPELVVAPLMGRDSSNVRNSKTDQSPNWMNGRPVRIAAYKVPADPVNGPWTPTVLNESLHVVHNFVAVPAQPGRSGLDLLTASYEGVNRLSRGANGAWGLQRLGEGNQAAPAGSRGSSEIKQGTLRDGRKYLATVEPWHGHQVVVYTPPADATKLWTRHVADAQLRWGHAVWCADLDGDGMDELIVGVRDNPQGGDDFKEQRGVRLYKSRDAEGRQWVRMMVDPNGVAVEDLAAADLNGDNRIDIVAVGRATGNVRIYWNEK